MAKHENELNEKVEEQQTELKELTDDELQNIAGGKALAFCPLCNGAKSVGGRLCPRCRGTGIIIG